MKFDLSQFDYIRNVIRNENTVNNIIIKFRKYLILLL